MIGGISGGSGVSVESGGGGGRIGGFIIVAFIEKVVVTPLTPYVYCNWAGVFMVATLVILAKRRFLSW